MDEITDNFSISERAVDKHLNTLLSGRLNDLVSGALWFYIARLFPANPESLFAIERSGKEATTAIYIHGKLLVSRYSYLLLNNSTYIKTH